MGVGGSENPWWLDVLEWGSASPYARYFDIDWNPQRPELHGKVLLPFLRDSYGATIERGELKPVFDAASGSFAIAYDAQRFPLATTTYPDLLAVAAERRGSKAWPLRALAAEFASADREHAIGLRHELSGVVAGEPDVGEAIAKALAYFSPDGAEAVDRLDGLLAKQHYRLSFWRVALHEINYRRFFDINELAGLRVEDAEVLAQTHRLIFEMIGDGSVQGLRIDHVDGLANPEGYCRFLEDRASALHQPLYLVVEKILAPFETLRGWQIDGTTGYDFMNLVNGLFVDPKAEMAFDRVYRKFAGLDSDFERVAYVAKRQIVRTSLASELTVLTTMLDRIAAMDRRSSDLTFDVLRDALTEIIASFAVYRTYVINETISPEDRAYIESAVFLARKRSDFGDDRVFDFIQSVLLLEAPHLPNARYDRTAVLQFAIKFQQYTGPVMAKSVEDTAFYRYVRLLSLNEVGGNPNRFGTTVDSFHLANEGRAAAYPHALLATATHDHKRGEDVRTRVDALTEMPGLWNRALKRWSRYNDRKKAFVDGNPAPSANDEYLIYQTLLGTWPALWLDREPDAQALEGYIERIERYLNKAVREAKLRSSWSNPNEAYEGACSAFLRRVLHPTRNALFRREFGELVREVATLGALSSLSQLTLKLTAPGAPDFYQGSELWDLSLVDPDNRGPVDFAARAAILETLATSVEQGNLEPLARELVRNWRDGRVKAFVTWRLLHLRRELAHVFGGGSYAALATRGERGENLVAFARGGTLVVVPRLMRRIVVRDAEGLRLGFGDERIVLRPGLPQRFVDRFTGASHEATFDRGEPTLRAAALLGAFPVAVLVPG
jgi:(1->4)-alpha-D-glucan 1-alpha-D-glucosylmutase